MTEKWKHIQGYEGLYQISSFGNVVNSKTDYFISQFVQNSGYLIVHLYKDNKRKAFTVHRLVALAFINNPENKPCI